MSVVELQQGSDEWLAARLETITATDIGSIIGENRWKDARTLAAEKLHLIEADVDPETQLLFDLGHIMEPALLAIYTRLTGRPVVSMSAFWHRSETHPWASASLDGLSDDRIVEAKWTNSYDWRGDEIPGRVFAQVQWQMFVTGLSWADVVVMEHGEPSIVEIARDEQYIENLIWYAERFREMLGRGELPEPDGSESSRHLISKLHPRDDGIMLAATPEWDGLAKELASAKEAAKEASDHQATVENAIRSILGDASGVIGRTYKITWKKNADSVRKNWPAIADEYRDLLAKRKVSPKTLDKIISIHSEMQPGPRVLRASFAGEVK
jgi:putative phage-type endonuclease